MSLPLTYMAAAAVVALAGAVHCVSMCGIFAGAVVSKKVSAAPLYFLAKTLTYVFIGIVAGTVGGALSSLRGLQSILAVLVGAAVVIQGLILIFGRSFIPPMLRSQSGAGSRLVSLVGKFAKSRSPVGLGVVNGLLPCGLVYAAALIAVASGSLANGALVMMTFGFATIPALSVLPALWGLVPAQSKGWKTAAGVALIIIGLITPFRMMHLTHGAHTVQEHETLHVAR